MNTAPSPFQALSVEVTLLEMISLPTPSDSGLPRRYGNFPTFPAALDYAAQGKSGFNIYSGKGVLLEALPYSTLREQAIETGQRLLSLGLEPGDRVAIVAESDGDFARIFFGCQYAGLVPAPLPLPVAFGGREGYVATLRGMIEGAAASAVVIAEIIAGWTDEITAGLDLKFSGTPPACLKRPLPSKRCLSCNLKTCPTCSSPRAARASPWGLRLRSVQAWPMRMPLPERA